MLWMLLSCRTLGVGPRADAPGEGAARLAATDGLSVQSASLQLDRVTLGDCSGQETSTWWGETLDLNGSNSLTFEPGDWCELEFQLTWLDIQATFNDAPVQVEWDVRGVELEGVDPVRVDGNAYILELAHTGWFQPTQPSPEMGMDHPDADVLIRSIRTTSALWLDADADGVLSPDERQQGPVIVGEAYDGEG